MKNILIILFLAFSNILNAQISERDSIAFSNILNAQISERDSIVFSSFEKYYKDSLNLKLEKNEIATELAYKFYPIFKTNMDGDDFYVALEMCREYISYQQETYEDSLFKTQYDVSVHCIIWVDDFGIPNHTIKLFEKSNIIGSYTFCKHGVWNYSILVFLREKN